MDLCQYKDVFGAVGTGPHSYRIFNIAIVDVVATLLFAYLISYTTNTSFLWVSVGCFILGIVAHRAFCVRTTIDKLLFSEG